MVWNEWFSGGLIIEGKDRKIVEGDYKRISQVPVMVLLAFSILIWNKTGQLIQRDETDSNPDKKYVFPYSRILSKAQIYILVEKLASIFSEYHVTFCCSYYSSKRDCDRKSWSCKRNILQHRNHLLAITGFCLTPDGTFLRWICGLTYWEKV